MMNRSAFTSTIILVVAVLVLAGAAPAWACQPCEAAKSQPDFHGIVTAIDTAHETFTLTDDTGKSLTFMASSKLLQRLGELLYCPRRPHRSGYFAVSYAIEGNGLRATSIEATSGTPP